MWTFNSWYYSFCWENWQIQQNIASLLNFISFIQGPAIGHFIVHIISTLHFSLKSTKLHVDFQPFILQLSSFIYHESTGIWIMSDGQNISLLPLSFLHFCLWSVIYLSIIALFESCTLKFDICFWDNWSKNSFFPAGSFSRLPCLVCTVCYHW